MKAIIMERRGEYAAVLCEDGTFVKTRASGEVGETIELKAEAIAFPKKKRAWMRSAVAAVLALTLTGGTLGYMGNTASAYVSLDVDEDSAIELTINHFGRVIAVNALDDDAKELAQSLSGEVRHHRAEDAFHITMERLHDKGYFGEAGGTVIVGVTSDDEKRAAELKGFAERSMERDGEHTVYVSEMSRAEREQAMEQHVSAGRFGFERDHRDGPFAPNGPGGQPGTEDTQPTLPAIPAGSEESGISGTTPSQSAEQSPTGGEQPQPGQEQPPTGGGQSQPGQEQPPTDGGQPQPGQEQPPTGGEQPQPGQEQPPTDGGQPQPGQEQPPTDGGQPQPGQEQPPTGGEQPKPPKEQPPTGGEQPQPGQEQPPTDGGQPQPGPAGGQTG